MNTATEENEWFTTEIGRRTVLCLPSEIVAENAKEVRVSLAIKSAPSYPALLKAYHRFRRNLNKYDYRPEVIESKPWDLLTAHAEVMNAKSACAQNMRRLALAIFTETKLPRRELGGFRGSDGVDWDRVEVVP